MNPKDVTKASAMLKPVAIAHLSLGDASTTSEQNRKLEELFEMMHGRKPTISKLQRESNGALFMILE
ncbi:hypothetical protein KKF55_04855 [Patescibacteria group bacterium]|nr:hypothetical protein [Patescibacteria group bacterium]